MDGKTKELRLKNEPTWLSHLTDPEIQRRIESLVTETKNPEADQSFLARRISLARRELARRNSAGIGSKK